MILPLIILQWNAQSLIAHGNELKHYIYNTTKKPNIICVQETWLKPNLNFKINGYSLIRKDRIINRGGGVCIFVENSITYNIKENKKLNIEFIHIEICINNKKYNIINIYNPGLKIIQADYDQLFAIKDCIICGDFNSNNPIWGSHTKDRNGKCLQEIMENNNLIVLNDGKGTHITNIGKLSNIDLTFTTDKISSGTTWNVTENTLGSDHYIIEIQLYNINHDIIKTNNYKWNYRKAKWNLFQENVENLQKEKPIENNIDVNNYNEIITNHIKISANKYIPKSKPKLKNPVPYWNVECNIAIKERKLVKKK
jgi:hypothetical protein